MFFEFLLLPSSHQKSHGFRISLDVYWEDMYYSDNCFFRVRWYKHVMLNKLFAWVRFSYELIFLFFNLWYSGVDFCIQCLYTILTVGKAHVVSKFQQQIIVLLLGRILKNSWYHPQIIPWNIFVIYKSYNVELGFKHSSSLVWSWKKLQTATTQ